MTPRARLAMSSDFLEAYTFLPKPQQRKVRTLITRFAADPTSPGLNYERVQAADNLRSLRIEVLPRHRPEARYRQRPSNAVGGQARRSL